MPLTAPPLPPLLPLPPPSAAEDEHQLAELNSQIEAALRSGDASLADSLCARLSELDEPRSTASQRPRAASIAFSADDAEPDTDDAGADLPEQSLAEENAALRAYVAVLTRRIDELERRVAEYEAHPAPETTCERCRLRVARYRSHWCQQCFDERRQSGLSIQATPTPVRPRTEGPSFVLPRSPVLLAANLGLREPPQHEVARVQLLDVLRTRFHAADVDVEELLQVAETLGELHRFVSDLENVIYLERNTAINPRLILELQRAALDGTLVQQPPATADADLVRLLQQLDATEEDVAAITGRVTTLPQLRALFADTSDPLAGAIDPWLAGAISAALYRWA